MVQYLGRSSYQLMVPELYLEEIHIDKFLKQVNQNSLVNYFQTYLWYNFLNEIFFLSVLSSYLLYLKVQNNKRECLMKIKFCKLF